VPPSLDEIKDNVRSFIIRATRVRSLKDSDELFRSGFVTSLFAMQLIDHIESEFPVFVESDEMKLHTFRSVDAIGDYVVRKLEVQSAAVQQS
jgi:acyl carrier protein